jgi:hypothetical protein
VINHCDRPITLPSDTDTVVRHSVINHCDIRITLLSDIYTVQSETYRISITKKCDTSITVIYHLMSLTVLYQYHQDE